MSRIVKVLEHHHPGKGWKAVRDGFGWVYTTLDGWRGEFRSCLVSMHPDDMDGHAARRFFIYKPNLPTEEISVLGGPPMPIP